ncbi:hypothetical protein SAMN06269117_11223 [Balnearium lithotrophicum]|uniref:Uncharacterized protein n=1 Tax=Balnearium lithotrophicum TaxID=223788 RepID=A0A521CE76_9BACT|nr:BrnT family toxin [Balnearium lithotrophicum]SMO57737.1 hypothetical protein SAMN06269117_11223 [Balnearium lithotrophicum]
MIPESLEFEWDENKSKKLKEKRGKSFEDILHYIQRGNVVSIQKRFNQKRYPGQLIIVLNIDGYPWVVPCELRGNKLRLITAYPSRKFKNLLKGKLDEK